VESSEPGAAAAALDRLGLAGIARLGQEVTAELGAAEPEKIVAALVTDGVPVRGFAVVSPGLEDLFVSLTGEGFDVSA
jgi:ABC-2 type transport system ATP-binding protein